MEGIETSEEGREQTPAAPSPRITELSAGPVLFVSSAFLLLEIGVSIAEARTSIPATIAATLSGALTLDAFVTAFEIGLVVALLALDRVHPAAAGLRFRAVPAAIALGGAIWALSQLALAIVSIGRHGTMSLYAGWVEPAAMIAPFFERFLSDVFAEEIFFRGILFAWILRSLEARRWRDPVARLGAALLGSQILFGITRLPAQLLGENPTSIPPGAALVAFTLTGIFYALIYLRTGNLWLVMLVHALSLWPVPALAFDVDPSKLTVLVSAILLIPTPGLGARRGPGFADDAGELPRRT